MNQGLLPLVTYDFYFAYDFIISSSSVWMAKNLLSI